MARTREERTKMVEILSENPCVHYACKKVGVSRATHYRWMKDNAEYRVEISRALKDGRTIWNENAEAALLKKVREGNMHAIKFYLSNNDPRYTPKRSIYTEPLTESERRAYERLQKEKGNLLTDEQVAPIMEALKNYGIIKEVTRITTQQSRNRER